jgi:hypothetical protein
MPLKLDLAQTVVVGAFNRRVITLEWLIRFGVYPSHVSAYARFDSDEGETSFAIREGPSSKDWDIDAERLSVTSPDPDADCGQDVSKVLELLPHTPVYAVGHNIRYVASRAEWSESLIPRLGDLDKSVLGGNRRLTWSCASDWNSGLLEMTVLCESDDVVIGFNHHRNIDRDRARQATRPLDQVAEAREAAEAFPAFHEHCRLILRDVLKVGMDS